MIYGVGIDSIEIERIKRELTRDSDSFCKSIFTGDEIAYCGRASNLDVKSQRLAGRFSAKEAFFKAIGTGLRDGLHWKDVEVTNDRLGKPHLVLRNRALEIIEREKISSVHLSISHSKQTATAVVILEK